MPCSTFEIWLATWTAAYLLVRIYSNARTHATMEPYVHHQFTANKQTNKRRENEIKLFSFGHFHLRNCIENNVDVSFPTSDCFCLSGQYFRWIFCVREMEWIAWNWWWDIATPTNISNNTKRKKSSKKNERKLRLDEYFSLSTFWIAHQLEPLAACEDCKIENIINQRVLNRKTKNCLQFF